MRDHFLKKVLLNKSSSVTARRYKTFYSALFAISKESEQPRSIEKRISEISAPWVIEFMHADYAYLLNWKLLGELRITTFLSNFICNNLGSHILEARIAKGWSAQSDEWALILKKKGKIVPRINSASGAYEQPIKVGKEHHCFSYLPEFEPRYPRNRYLVTHEMHEMFDFK